MTKAKEVKNANSELDPAQDQKQKLEVPEEQPAKLKPKASAPQVKPVSSGAQVESSGQSTSPRQAMPPAPENKADPVVKFREDGDDWADVIAKEVKSL